jgi:hypothetical protein
VANTIHSTSENDRAEFAAMIARRVADLKEELEALLVLQRKYAPGAPTTVASSPAGSGNPTRAEVGIVADPTLGGVRRGGASPPPVTIKPGGMTESILKVMNAHPEGLEAAQLIDLVEPIVNTTSTDKRAAISSAARSMSDRGYIVRRGGLYFPATQKFYGGTAIGAAQNGSSPDANR